MVLHNNATSVMLHYMIVHFFKLHIAKPINPLPFKKMLEDGKKIR